MADVAYPGQKFPKITGTVAAVHIEKVDRANLSVTVEVSIICPADMGGTACEVEALRATEVLRWAGAVCVQNGCTYDGVSQVYVVSVLATFTAITEAEDCTIGPGYSVYIDGYLQPYTVSVSAWEEPGRKAEYVMGQSAPEAISQGSWLWNIELEELIPSGSPETAEPLEEFQLKIETEQLTEVYYHCLWTERRREFSQKGLRRIRRGIAMSRGEE